MQNPAALQPPRQQYSAASTRDSNTLLTRPEAAALLNVALRTVDALIATGDVPCVRIGRAIRFRPAALQMFVEASESRRNPRRARKTTARKAATPA
jgi:excisionase family DNA binding protein